MEIVLNGNDVVVLDDQRTRRGYRMISCSPGAHLNPVSGVVVFFEDPQVGASPWISYVKLDEQGEPDLAYAPTRMPLSKARITHVTT
jgi:hypothetical protein